MRNNCLLFYFSKTKVSTPWIYFSFMLFVTKWGGGGSGKWTSFFPALLVLCSQDFWSNNFCLLLKLPQRSCWGDRMIVLAVLKSHDRLQRGAFNSLIAFSPPLIFSVCLHCSDSLIWHFQRYFLVVLVDGSLVFTETCRTPGAVACSQTLNVVSTHLIYLVLVFLLLI